tara:strand:- start:432 stop:536 length:105 start_codon:yes stop_codon:yes gene_type:complete
LIEKGYQRCSFVDIVKKKEGVEKLMGWMFVELVV